MTTSEAVYHHCDACQTPITSADAPVECAVCRPPDLLADVREFHEKFGLAYRGRPRTLPDELREFRVGFLKEEIREYADQVERARGLLMYYTRASAAREIGEALAEQLDALVDLVYVALGNAHLQGFDFNAAWRRVHAANMSKERATSATASVRGGVFDVVKPPGWTAPDHTDLVADHAHQETAP